MLLAYYIMPWQNKMIRTKGLLSKQMSSHNRYIDCFRMGNHQLFEFFHNCLKKNSTYSVTVTKKWFIIESLNFGITWDPFLKKKKKTTYKDRFCIIKWSLIRNGLRPTVKCLSSIFQLNLFLCSSTNYHTERSRFLRRFARFFSISFGWLNICTYTRSIWFNDE